MYDINISNVKKGTKFYLAFLFVGLFFLVIILAIFISDFFKYKSLDSEIMSTRVEISSYQDTDGNTMYSPIYYYNVKGKEYACKSNFSSSLMPSTENEKVYYDSKSPSRCMPENSSSINILLLTGPVLPIIFIVIAIRNIVKIKKRIKSINELNNTGKLVKNLPYRLENTGMSVNDVPIQRPVVDYIMPSGTMVTLYGDPRHDNKYSDADGMVDLIIDEANPNNYFIDFEINRLSGNLPTDYYTNNQVFQNNPNNSFIDQQGTYMNNSNNFNQQDMYMDNPNNFNQQDIYMNNPNNFNQQDTYPNNSNQQDMYMNNPNNFNQQNNHQYQNNVDSQSDKLF